MDGAHCCHAGITCSSNKLYEACRPDLENQTLYAFPGARPACGHLASQQLAQPTKAMMSCSSSALGQKGPATLEQIVRACGLTQGAWGCKASCEGLCPLIKGPAATEAMVAEGAFACTSNGTSQSECSRSIRIKAAFMSSCYVQVLRSPNAVYGRQPQSVCLFMQVPPEAPEPALGINFPRESRQSVRTQSGTNDQDVQLAEL
eukprot:1155358-Pelagomonas_calceolata.AAC.11